MPQPCLPPMPLGPFDRPLPGTHAYRLQQAEADCRTLTYIAHNLRRMAQGIPPALATLACLKQPLAVLECAPTLLALADEIEQDDIPSVQQAAE